MLSCIGCYLLSHLDQATAIDILKNEYKEHG